MYFTKAVVALSGFVSSLCVFRCLFLFRHVSRNFIRRMCTLLLFCIWHTQEDANVHEKNSCTFPACTCSKLPTFAVSFGRSVWVLGRGSCWMSFLSRPFLFVHARVTFRTLSFRESLSVLVFFHDCKVCHLLLRSDIDPRIDVPVFNFLFQKSAYLIFQSSVSGSSPFWLCILSIQCRSRLQLFWIFESHLV